MVAPFLFIVQNFSEEFDCTVRSLAVPLNSVQQGQIYHTLRQIRAGIFPYIRTYPHQY